MLRLLAIPIALVVLLAGALVYSGGAVEKRPEFSFINRGDIYTLDINTMSYMQDFRLTYGIREGLYGVKPDTLEPIPAGATRCDVSPDKKTWTFHLRPESRWSNGDPVRARDYVFSWRRMLEEPGEYTYLFDTYIHNAKKYEDGFVRGNPTIDFSQVGIETPDELTFKVTLDNPVPFLLELAAFPPFYPRNERSMAEFRVFTDSNDQGTDVMDAFERFVNAAQKIDASGSPQDMANRFTAAVGIKGRTLDAEAVGQWLKFAKGFVIKQKTQAELLDALAVFARMDPLAGVPAEAASAASADEGGGAAADEMASLTPAQKLQRMLDKHFVRCTFNKAYTVPPKVVTNGPFLLTKWDFRRRLLLEKSPTYWDKANVRLNSIEMEVIEDANSQLLAYETGQVEWNADLMGAPYAAELKAQGNKDLRYCPAFGTAFITILCTPKLPGRLGGGPNPLADVRVRQALAMAVDKRFIVQNLSRMGELPARTYLPPDGTLPKFTFMPGPGDVKHKGQPYTFKEVQAGLASSDGLTGEGPGLAYDPERARQLLAEAGYPNGKGFPRLPISYNTDSPLRRDICQALQNQWKSVLNVDVFVDPQEGKIYKRVISAKEYAIGLAAWFGDYPDVSTFTDKYISTSLQNDSDWREPAYDDLCKRAMSEPDEHKRITMLSEAENMIDTQVPIVPLYHYVNISMNPDWVHGVDANPRGVTVFKGVWIDHDQRAREASRR